MNKDLEKFLELLPFFVNNSLKKEERLFVKNFLDKNPEYQEEYEFLKHLRLTVKHSVSEHSSTQGFQRLQKAIKEKENSSNTKKYAIPRLWESFWINWGLTPAMTAAALLITSQSLVIFELWTDKPVFQLRSEYQIAPNISSKESFTLKLTISPTANFGELSRLLYSINGRIIQGPSKDNELWLSFQGDSSQLKNNTALLSASPFVINIESIVTQTNASPPINKLK